jgi:acetyl-CoA synthetase
MISSVLEEKRRFKPKAQFLAGSKGPTEKALEAMRKKAARDPEAFWKEQALKLTWKRSPKKGLSGKAPHNTWFSDGRINAAYNCLDVHLTTGRRNKAALIWEGETGETRTLTYLQLSHEVNRLSNALTQTLGVKPGDVVGIYMGMVPEAVIAMLACARIGATHNVVFGGFSGEALRDRLNDSRAKVLLTQDGVHRKGIPTPLKAAIDESLASVPSLKHVVVLERTFQDAKLKQGRDVLWKDLLAPMSHTHEASAFPAEHPLFILYTSGSTGKPKGILHTTGGYLTQAKYSANLVFDFQDTDLFFCTADIGWITGHTYVTYGPLLCGASVFLYEGVPTYPEADRFWKMIERHKITIFYTAPTAIRTFMRLGDQYPKRCDLSSLRLLGSVGEPINPEAWMWYSRTIGKMRCPIVDTWWQTETGSILISPVASATTLKPGTATRPLPGMDIDVVDKDGKSCKANEGGLLVIKKPWPGMLRTIYGDPKRYIGAYWSEFPGSKTAAPFYFTGDGARKDRDGYFWIMGRVDDVVNISGHRLGTAEVESALVANPSVAEAAVVARPDPIKGHALVAFVVLRQGAETKNLNGLPEVLRNWVAKQIGPIAKPDEIRITGGLPKTRSGKIMRRLLREIITNGTTSGDVTTLEDMAVLAALRQDEE